MVARLAAGLVAVVTAGPRPRLPAGVVAVDLAELERLLDAGATRQEIRAWLGEQATRDRERGGTDAPA